MNEEDKEAFLHEIWDHDGKPMYYRLDGHEAVPCSLHDWSTMFATQDTRTVAVDHIGPYMISTIFLGMNHRGGDGPPLLFETMVFCEHAPKAVINEGEITVEVESPLLADAYPEINRMDRYATWDDAAMGHTSICFEVDAIIKERMDASLLDNR